MIELPGLAPHEVAELIPMRPIIVCYRGSHAHGTFIPSTNQDSIDDIDILSVYIPDLSFYFGLPRQAKGEQRWVREWDAASYELTHFVGLLSKGNPSVMATLWTKPEHTLLLSREGTELRDNRSLFATRAAAAGFIGYAYGQLKRMTSWHEERAAGCGCTGEFHAADCPLVKERGRGSQKLYATGHLGAKRRALVESVGYDAKNAGHCIRLLRMLIEFLSDGELRVDRTGIDAEELIAIKTGKWTLADVQSLADDLFRTAKGAVDKSPLPEAVDTKKVGDLVLDMLCVAHAGDATMRKHWVDTGRPSGLNYNVRHYEHEVK